jgi:hypothetical protein
MTRSGRSSHGRTGISLIIVVRLHVLKTVVQFLSTLLEKFQVRRKVRRDRWRILTWFFWDGSRTEVSMISPITIR